MNDLPFILGLDISKSRSGACFGRPGEMPRFVSITGNDMDDQAAAARLGRWLIEFTKVEKVDAIFIEAQLRMIPGEYDHEKQRVVAKGNPDTVITLAKMIGVAEFIAGMKSIRTRTPGVSTVRKSFLGKGNLKSADGKKAAALMCAELGWNAANNDEADAAAIWFHGCLQLKPHAAHLITPMMQQRIVGMALSRISRAGALNATPP